MRVQPWPAQKRSTATGSTSGSPRRNQPPNVDRVASLSITNAVPPRRTTRLSSAQPGLAAGPEEVRPPGVRDVHRRVGQRELLGRAGEQRDVRSARRVRRAARRSSAGCGSTPYTRAAVAAKRGRWKPVPQPRSSTTRPAQSATDAHGRSSRPSRSTARFSSSYVAGCCQTFGLARRSRFRDGSLSPSLVGTVPSPPTAALIGALAGSVAGRQTRTRPFGVWNCAAMMPGVPFGATHSTLTSSSGASTVTPSHSLTRCGSPAISRHASDQSSLPPVDGCSASGLSHCDEERQLGVGDQAVDADLLPAAARCRRGDGGCPATASRPSRCLDGRDVVDRDDPAEPAAAEGGAGAHGLAERCLVGGGVVEDLDDLEVGVVGQRQDHVAGPEAGVDATIDELTAEQPPDALGGAGEAVRAGGEAEMVQAHAEHSAPRRRGCRTGGRVS